MQPPRLICGLVRGGRSCDEQINAKTENKTLNSFVAITVVIVSVFLAISKLKDDNLIRSMAFVKADSVDIWNEYQSERIKLHNDENAQVLAAERARLDKQIAKYTAQSKALAAKAQSSDVRYEAMNYRHDQFDVEDGVLSITLALTAVAALTELSGSSGSAGASPASASSWVWPASSNGRYIPKC